MTDILTKLQARIDSGIPAIADLHLLRDGLAEIERLTAENLRFRQGLFGGNVTAPRDDLAASQGPKQPAKAEDILN